MDENRPETEVVYDDTNDSLGDGSVTEPPPEAAPPEDVETEVIERITAAMDFLLEQGANEVAIYGEGIAVARAMNYLGKQGNIDNRIRALIFYNGYNRAPYLDTNAVAVLRNNKLPILDFLSTNTDLLAYAAKARQTQARRTRQPYQQHFLLPFGRDEAINKKVYGFLKRYFD